jgi:hypothetical protein
MKKTNVSDLEADKQSFEVENKSIMNWELYYEAEKIPITKFRKFELILPFDQFVKQLTESQITAFLNHFNAIYACEKLEKLELEICYLAYLCKHKQVNLTNFGYEIRNSDAKRITDFTDYKINIEASQLRVRGVSFEVLNDYYDIKNLEKLV